MSKHNIPSSTFTIELDRSSLQPLYRQVYERLRHSILSGQLKAGQRLPSTRTLASELAVSRNTTSWAYEQLFAEGYLHSTVGRGTIVAPQISEGLLSVAPVTARQSPSQEDTLTLSQLGSTIAQSQTIPIARAGKPKPFRSGISALDAFPYHHWEQLLIKRAKNSMALITDYQQAVGYQPLREAIALHIGVTRGVRCQAEQIIVVTGSQQALDLAARLFLNPGDLAWVEEPGYFGTRNALQNAGAILAPIPVREEGMDVQVGRERYPHARLAAVTPSHQFPLGMTMSLKQRFALLEWAHQANAWILEDDYDSEYRYSGRPLEALQGLDRGQRVICIGTFSKVLFPSLRLGYLVVPPTLIDHFTALYRSVSVHAPILEQAVLTDFMQEGHFARHIRHMRSLYRARRDALVQAMQSEIGDKVQFQVPETGMHMVIWLPWDMNDVAITQQATSQGLEVYPLSQLFL
ncbi:MAG TPA: PLP-dependent aminotransferase family protein, partial [Ktedonobacteraceae bacterium]